MLHLICKVNDLGTTTTGVGSGTSAAEKVVEEIKKLGGWDEPIT